MRLQKCGNLGGVGFGQAPPLVGAILGSAGWYGKSWLLDGLCAGVVSGVKDKCTGYLFGGGRISLCPSFPLTSSTFNIQIIT